MTQSACPHIGVESLCPTCKNCTRCCMDKDCSNTDFNDLESMVEMIKTPEDAKVLAMTLSVPSCVICMEVDRLVHEGKLDKEKSLPHVCLNG